MFAKQTLQRIATFSRSKVGPKAFMMPVRVSSVMGAAATRAFSSDINDGAQKLNRALEKEIKYENENYTQLEDIETFLNESGFQFSEEENGIFMSLKKQVGDKHVEVTFEARQPIPDDQQFSEQEHEDEEGAPETENYCDFTVYVTDSSGKTGMVIEGTTVDTEINYNSVQVSQDVSEQKNLHRLERQIRMYAGPDFSTLDERIQTALTEYLEGFGINEHLGAFVECMSLDKDQRLYMAWLTNLKNFVNDK